MPKPPQDIVAIFHINHKMYFVCKGDLTLCNNTCKPLISLGLQVFFRQKKREKTHFCFIVLKQYMETILQNVIEKTQYIVFFMVDFS